MSTIIAQIGALLGGVESDGPDETDEDAAGQSVDHDGSLLHECPECEVVYLNEQPHDCSNCGSTTISISNRD